MKRWTQDDVEGVARRCRAARLAAGLTQREATKGMPGLSHAYLSRIELADRMPSIGAIRLLAERYGVSATWLETGDDVVELELDRSFVVKLQAAGVSGELRAEIDRVLATVGEPPRVTA